MLALSAYTCISSGSWTDSRSATKNADMDLLTLSMTNHNLAEYVASSVVSPCRFRVRERKHAVDYRVHGVRIDRALHRFYIDAASDADAAERRLTHEKAHEIQTAIALSECPDERDLATVGHSLERLRERPRPTHLNDPIDASPGGQRAHGLRPLGVLDVVDNRIRADLFQPLAIPGAGRGGDHAGSEELGELQREERYTARALSQNRVACTDARECRPGRDGCAWQRRCLFEGQTWWRERERLCSHHLELGEPAIPIGAVRFRVGCARASVPSGKKPADHTIAHIQRRNASADHFHFAGCVGDRDDSGAHWER